MMRTILARSLYRAQPWRDATAMGRGWETNTSASAGRTIRPGFQRRYRTNKSDDLQKFPLEGYYADILSRPSRTTSDSKSSVPTTSPVSSGPQRDAPANAPVTEAAETEDREKRAELVFGSRLVGPERRRELDKSAKVIAGVKIPPRPEEPDNCCMSGCANCVWDLYRDELEEWAAASAEAKKKLAVMEQGTTHVEEGREEIMGEGLAAATGNVSAGGAASMDDDGGGREMNVKLDAGNGEEDLLSGIPVGIRAFMLMEKSLKQKQGQDKGPDG